jgi:periplasmic protein CpxP/Spy
MRLALAVVAAISLAACSKTDTPNADTSTAPAADAAAQTGAPQADASASGNAAVKAPHPENAGPPAAGANSFTEGQAKEHIEHSGYTNVTDLMKDDKGVWHGKATKGGATMNVALDFKGNVVTN